jgi:hypothetical protein
MMVRQAHPYDFFLEMELFVVRPRVHYANATGPRLVGLAFLKSVSEKCALVDVICQLEFLNREFERN